MTIKRLAPGTQHLTPQAVKELRRRREIDDLHVVFGAEQEKALEPRARVLGPLALHAVRQQHDQAAQALPFVFGRGDELVDDHLGDVDEVAELRFPANQGVRRVERVAPFEAEDADFGKRAVVDLKVRLVGAQMPEPRVPAAGLCIEDDRVPVAEGAAADILAGEPAADALEEKARESEVLRRCPSRRLRRSP